MQDSFLLFVSVLFSTRPSTSVLVIRGKVENKYTNPLDIQMFCSNKKDCLCYKTNYFAPKRSYAGTGPKYGYVLAFKL